MNGVEAWGRSGGIGIAGGYGVKDSVVLIKGDLLCALDADQFDMELLEPIENCLAHCGIDRVAADGGDLAVEQLVHFEEAAEILEAVVVGLQPSAQSLDVLIRGVFGSNADHADFKEQACLLQMFQRLR